MFIDYGSIYRLWFMVIDYGLWVKFMAMCIFLVMVYGLGLWFIVCGLWLWLWFMVLVHSLWLVVYGYSLALWLGFRLWFIVMVLGYIT